MMRNKILYYPIYCTGNPNTAATQFKTLATFFKIMANGQAIQLLDTVQGTPTQLLSNSKLWPLFLKSGQLRGHFDSLVA